MRGTANQLPQRESIHSKYDICLSSSNTTPKMRICMGIEASMLPLGHQGQSGRMEAYLGVSSGTLAGTFQVQPEVLSELWTSMNVRGTAAGPG